MDWNILDGKQNRKTKEYAIAYLSRCDMDRGIEFDDILNRYPEAIVNFTARLWTDLKTGQQRKVADTKDMTWDEIYRRAFDPREPDVFLLDRYHFVTGPIDRLIEFLNRQYNGIKLLPAEHY